MNYTNCFAKIFRIAMLIIGIYTPSCAFATEDDAGAWLTFSISDAIRSGGEDTRWHYWVDAQSRFFDPGSGVNQSLIRPAVGYSLTNKMKAWIGYARFHTSNRAGTVSDENRYWQQIDGPAGRLAGGNVSMRARLEQRSLSIGEDVGVVLRLMTKYVRPIGAEGRNTLIIGVEPFVDLRDTDWGGDSGLAQNRTFVGMGWRASKSLSVEAGYMNQFIWVDAGEDRSFHHAVINFNVRL